MEREREFYPHSPRHQFISALDLHHHCRLVRKRGGVVTMFKGIPEEQQWAQVKAAVQEPKPAGPMWGLAGSDKKPAVFLHPKMTNKKERGV